MADWRYFEPAFWSEEDIQGLTFEEKSFYIYLFTNEHCNQAGVYRITKKTIAFETGLAEDRVEELLIKFIKDKKIELFDGLVWMKNFLKHQPSQNPSVWKRIIKDVQRMQIHSSGLMKKYVDYISRLPITCPQDIDSLIAGCQQGVNTIIRKERETETETEKKQKEKKNTSKEKHNITFNFSTSQWENITEKDKKGWQEAYPACGIDLELKQMREWIISNPDKRKQRYRRFITNWLGRKQDRGGSNAQSRGSARGGPKRRGKESEKYRGVYT